MLVDRELRACANRLVEQRGRGALMKAGERIAAVEAAGDVEGHSGWVMIFERVVKLLREKLGRRAGSVMIVHGLGPPRPATRSNPG